MKHRLTDAMIEEIADLLSAMADRSRLRILRALLSERLPLSQGVIARAANLSQANTSKHLGSLVRAGLVTRHPEGNTVFFRPVLPLVAEVCDLVCGHAAFRARSSYRSLVEKLPRNGTR